MPFPQNRASLSRPRMTGHVIPFAQDGRLYVAFPCLVCDIPFLQERLAFPQYPFASGKVGISGISLLFRTG